MQQGRPLLALDYLQRAEKRAPANIRVAYALARFYLNQADEEQARRALEKCLQLSPRHQGALGALINLEMRARRTERALELQQRLIAAEPPRLYSEWARLGVLYLSTGQLEKALDAFAKSLELEPLGYVAHRNLADQFARVGETTRALEEYRFLIQYYPTNDPHVYLELSSLYRKSGRERAARQTLQKAKRIFPANPEVEQALW
jgi:tetratricopeptide (TPR) repeat protein